MDAYSYCTPLLDWNNAKNASDHLNCWTLTEWPTELDLETSYYGTSARAVADLIAEDGLHEPSRSFLREGSGIVELAHPVAAFNVKPFVPVQQVVADRSYNLRVHLALT